MAKLIELPTDPAQAYEPPADATADDLAALIKGAHDEASRLLENPNATAEDIAQAERYIAAKTAISARQQAIVAEAEEHQARIDAAKAALGDGPGAEDKDPAKDKEKDKDKDPAADKTPPVTSPANGEVSDPSVNPTGDQLLVASAQPTTALVTRRRRSAVSAAASAADAPTVADGESPGAFLVAAAEVKGMQAGAVIGWDDFGKAALQRFGALPHPRPGTSRPSGGRTQLAIGSVHIPTHDAALVASAGTGDFVDADEAIEWAVSHRRLLQAGGDGNDGSLVAAGGWCAPSETLYELLDITTDDGMLDVPGITVTRGGVRYSLGPDFTAVYSAGAFFTRTESQAIAGTPPKPMVNIPCPNFTDNRMVVDGMYLTGDILSSKGYPEAYADFTQKSLKAFAHYVNAASIQDMAALCGGVIDISASVGTAPVTNRTHSAAVELLGAVELQITDMRYKNRLSMTQAVEVILPFWVKGNIRSDIAKRQGYENALMVSDADIASWFALRHAAVQFVYDYQDAFTGQVAGFGSGTAITSWPNQCEFLIYPEGSFVRALDPVIELNAVYDSVLLQTNQYVALFMEQARLTLKRHHDVRRVKVDVSPLGGTSAGSPVGANGLTGAVL